MNSYFFKLLCTLQIKKLFLLKNIWKYKETSLIFYFLFYTLINKILGIYNIFKIKIIQVVTIILWRNYGELLWRFEFLCLLQELLGMKTWVYAQQMYFIDSCLFYHKVLTFFLLPSDFLKNITEIIKIPCYCSFLPLFLYFFFSLPA